MDNSDLLRWLLMAAIIPAGAYLGKEFLRWLREERDRTEQARSADRERADRTEQAFIAHLEHLGESCKEERLAFAGIIDQAVRVSNDRSMELTKVVDQMRRDMLEVMRTGP